MSHTLRSVELFMVRLPLVRPFTTSSHTKHHLDHILIRVRDQHGAEGWGECASASDPYYCSETSETSWHILRDFLVPGVLGVEWSHPDGAASSWASPPPAAARAAAGCPARAFGEGGRLVVRTPWGVGACFREPSSTLLRFASPSRSWL